MPSPNGRLKPLVRQSLALGRPTKQSAAGCQPALHSSQAAKILRSSSTPCTTSTQGVIIRRSTQEDPCLLDVLSPAAPDSQPPPLQCPRKLLPPPAPHP